MLRQRVGQVPLTALLLLFVSRCAPQVDAMDTAHRSVTELVPETGKTSPSDKPQPASSSSSSFPSPTQHAAAEPEKKLREVQRTTEKQDEQEKEYPEVEEHDRSAAAKGEEDRNGEAQAFAEFNVREKEKLAHVAPGQPDHKRKTKGGAESVLEAQTETPGPRREAAGASSPQGEASDPNEKVATAQDEKIAPHQRWPLSDVPQWLAAFVDKKAPMLGREPAAEREHAPSGREEAGGRAGRGDLEQQQESSSSALEVGADAAPGVAAASGSVVNPDASTAKKSTTVILMHTSPAPAEAGDSSKSPATSTTSAGNEKDFPNKLTPTPGIWSNPPTGESLGPDMTCKEEWCSSPGPKEKPGTKDCFAGSGEEPCTCDQGSAVQLDETVWYEGATYYRYVCCKLEPDDERWHAAHGNGKEKHYPNFTGEYCGRYHGGLLFFWVLLVSCLCCSGCGMLIGSTDFMKGTDVPPAPPQPNVPVSPPPQPNVPVPPPAATGSQT